MGRPLTTTTGIIALYEQLFPENSSTVIPSLTLDAQLLTTVGNVNHLTRQFIQLLGTAEAVLVINDPKSSAPLNNSFGFSGNTALFKDQLPCTLNATFSEADSGVITFTIDFTPTIKEVLLLDLLHQYGLVPVNYIDASQFPAMKLSDLQLHFDSQQQSLKINSGSCAFPLATTFAPLKGLLPKKVDFSLDVSLDPVTQLKQIQGYFEGPLEENPTYQARIQFPLGLMNSWQLTLQSTGTSDYPLPDSIAPLFKPLFQSLSDKLPVVTDQHLQLDTLHAQFFPETATPFIYGIDASFVSKLSCEMLPELLRLPQFSINVSGRGPEFQLNGQLSGIGRFGGSSATDGFDAQVTLPLPISSQTLNINVAQYKQSVSWELVRKVFSLPNTSLPQALNAPQDINLVSLNLEVQTSKKNAELTTLSINLGYEQPLRMNEGIQLQKGASLGFFYESKNNQFVLSRGYLSGLTVAQPKQPEAKASYVYEAANNSWEAQPQEPLPSRTYAPNFTPPDTPTEPETSTDNTALQQPKLTELTTGNALLTDLYKTIFHRNWIPSTPVVLDSLPTASPLLPTSMTQLFQSLLGATTASITIDGISAKPAAPGSSLTFSGTTTSILKSGETFNVTVNFTEISEPTSALVLQIAITRSSGNVSLSNLISDYNIIPSSLNGYTYPASFSLPDVSFQFDSQQESLKVTSGNLTDPLQTIISGIPGYRSLPSGLQTDINNLVPSNLSLGFDITINPSTTLTQYHLILAGDATLGTTYHGQLRIPLGLMSSWQLQIYPVGSGTSSINLSTWLADTPLAFLSAILPASLLDDIVVSYFNSSFFLHPSTSVYNFDVSIAATPIGLTALNDKIATLHSFSGDPLGNHVLNVTGLSFDLSGKKKSSGSGFDFYAHAHGQAFFGSLENGFPAQVEMTLLPSFSNIQIKAQSVTVTGVWSMFKGLLGIEKNSILPLSVSFTKALILDSIQLDIGHDSSKFELKDVYLTLSYNENIPLPWFHQVYLQAGASLNIALKRDSNNKLQLESTQIEGTMVLGNIQIGVALSQPTKGAGWGFSITSDEIVLPSISDLAAFAVGGTLEGLLPAGIRNTGNFTLANLNIDLHTQKPYLRNLSFLLSYSDTSPKWVLIPNYLDIDKFALSANLSPQEDGKQAFSGYVNGVVDIAGVEILLQADKHTAQDPWVFKGSTVGAITVDLPAIAQHFNLPQAIVTSLPTPTINSLQVTTIPQTGAFAANVDITFAAGWPFEKLSLTTIDFVISRTKTNVDAHVEGKLALGATHTAPVLDLTADYNSTTGWKFTGSLETGSGVQLSYLLNNYLGLTPGHVPDITIQRLEFTGTPKDKQYTFTIGCEWDVSFPNFDLGSLTTTATAQLIYNGNALPRHKKYEGSSIKGTLDFHGIELSVNAIFGTTTHYVFNLLGVTGDLNPTENSISFSLQNKSVGEMITMLVTAATGDNITLPAPWNALNSVKLNDFHLVFKSPPSPGHKTVELDCDINLNLGIADIQSFGLMYDKSKPKGQRVKVNVTGSFLGVTINPQSGSFNQWHADDPNSAPKVPGKGNKMFELNLLGLGQHVALPPNTATMQQAISKLRETFQHPGAPTGVTYDEKNSWLIATQFTVMEMVELSILFQDPQLYGLLINLTGGKFKGLEFEILYRKINDSVGVYYIEFSLPNYLRYLQFGAVSITLPDLKIWIYTNGGFKIDLGFPYHDSFQQSGGVQVLPFVGAGGFYFGILHGQTSSRLPAITVEKGGNFNPVIVFGLGLQVGLGKSIHKGPISAEVKLALEGIFEGVLAPFHPYDSRIEVGTTDIQRLFYYLKAEVGIVGRISGQLNLAIISASLNLVARITATAIVEAYRAIELSFTASATISVSVSIDCWLFTIHFTIHFDFEFSDHFTLGSNTLGPWDQGYPLPPAAERLSPNDAWLFADAPLAITIATMNWNAPAPSPVKETMNLYYMYKLTLATIVQERTSSKEVQLESLLFIDAPSVLGEHTEETSFGKLAEALMLWTFNSYLNPDEPIDDILDRKLSYDNLQELEHYFEQMDNGVPKQTIDANDMSFFFEHFLNVNLCDAITNAESLQHKTLSVFPMLSDLELDNGGETINYSEPKCSPEYFVQIRESFEDWT